MSPLDRALFILANAQNPRHWEQAASELRGICHTEAGVACPTCWGQGTRQYGSGRTWRKGGVGTSAMTEDVCDVCWGTGRTDITGVDLRELEGRCQRLENEHGREASSKWLSDRLGLSFTQVRAILPNLATRLRRLRGVEFWTAGLCDRLASALEEMAQSKGDAQ